MKKLLPAFRALSLFTFLAVPAFARAEQLWPADAKITLQNKIDRPEVLRGFGKATVFLNQLSSDDITAGLYVLESSSAENASTAAGKFLADLDLSPGVRKDVLTVGGKKFPLVTVPGGSVYTGLILGDTAYILAAPSRDAIEHLLETSPIAKNAKLVTEFNYPTYLDRFDRYGWGFYGLDPQYQRPAGENPMDDFDFCAKNGFRFELWPNPANMEDSYSIPDWPGMNWKVVEAGKRGIATSARSYIGGGDNILPVRKELTELQQQSPPTFDGGWYGSSLEYRSRPQQSWFNEQARLYGARQTQDMMRGILRIDPNVQSWMLPYGELSTAVWYAGQCDRSPAAMEAWRQILRDTSKLSLAQVSAMFGRKDKPFTKWDDVPAPDFETFEGLPGMVQDLDNEWYVRPETTPDEGTSGDWLHANISDAAHWEKLDLPGDTRWYKYFRKTNWLIREFTVPPELLARGDPLYLYNFIADQNNDPRVVAPTYLNGQKVGEPSNWGAWDVSKILKPGLNRVVVRSQAGIFGGRVFLSTEKPTLFPYMDPERMKLWTIFNDWAIGSQFGSCETMLKAMREIDPNRWIKFMAPHQENIGQWLELEAKYGTWGHFTGEGKFYFPWFKRSQFLYDVPGTSEGAGPPYPDAAKGIPQTVDLVQRVFLAGLNAHDQTFTVQDISRVPPVRKWYEDHMAVLRQLGRYDISGPQVLIYRSADYGSRMEMSAIPAPEGAPEAEVQNIYNWDIGRGTLQSIGQSALYVDDIAIHDDKLKGYSMLMDCGNEIVRQNTLNTISDWVKNGGTYIVWPFTGRSLATAPDTWPIQMLTGCKVKAIRKPGQGSVTIDASQTLLKELAGKTFPDNGSSLDWQDGQHNLISTELEPGADCQVLAKFENGAPAMVMHMLGKGRVITLGSAFFRDSHDVNGVWPCTQKESDFFRDLLTGLGSPSVNAASDHDVWVQRYRTNNGLDDVVVLNNFANCDRKIDLSVTLDRKPTKIYQVAMNSVNEVAQFTADGGKITIPQIAIPKGEVQVFYFRNAEAPDAVAHWWNYQQRMWHPLAVSPKLDFSSISHGHWIDPTVDLKREWKWTQDGITGESWHEPAFDDASWKNWDLDIFNAEGATPDRPVFARKSFTVPSTWVNDGGVTRLTAGGPYYNFVAGDSDFKFYLNGQLLQKQGYFNPDVAKLLHPGKNTLALEIDKPRRENLIGVFGALYLVHEKLPVKTVSLAGDWIGQASGKPVTLAFPGTGTATDPSREVMIPADWKDKYVVTYFAKGDGNSTLGVVVNNRYPVRHLGNGDIGAEIDITPYLHFGEKNVISPMYRLGDYVGKMNAPVPWNISQVELRLYPRAEYRN
jgi:hypothetical protein